MIHDGHSEQFVVTDIYADTITIAHNEIMQDYIVLMPIIHC